MADPTPQPSPPTSVAGLLGKIGDVGTDKGPRRLSAFLLGGTANIRVEL